ncbi:MAG: hypothetical protein EOP90_14040 [Lysobacteraceae bacterium]|nr:MAG: hypothetical protein EOP90_14040 [Xanthomonadaceae bacterium]
MARDPTARGGWYRQPVAWLGLAILVASLAGCIWMIVLGARHADEPVPTGARVFKVPTTAPADAPPERPPEPAQ